MTGPNQRIRIKKKDTEIEIEGDKDFVEKNIKEMLKIFNRTTSEGVGHDSSKDVKKAPTTPVGGLIGFYMQKNPTTLQHRTLVFVYWLSKKKTPPIPEPTNADIENCFGEVSVQSPKNLADMKAKLRGKKPPLLLKGKAKGTCRLSMDGKKFVEKDLPKK